MHIKQVLIEGFKSYKSQTDTEEFDPRINVIVGANGSGKSNFFHAIRFVLNDAFINIRGDERLALLHEGAGQRVSSAWVEVVFDNSDGRFPSMHGGTEVRLRRTITSKKDEYTLDRKHINKSEVSNLLESAGFSKSNPYYIVQQGKITAMAAMSDVQRVELLKEIGGTRVYEERRRESLRILNEADSRNAQIREMLSDIESKLSELDAERAELAEFQALDRRRRCLQYTLYDKELAKAAADVEKLEKEAVRLRESLAANGEGGEAGEAGGGALKELERRLRAVGAEAEEAARQAAELQDSKQALTRKRAALEAEVEELGGKVRGAERLAEVGRRELQGLRDKIKREQERVAELRAAADAAAASQDRLAGSIAESEGRLAALYRKQGAQSQYRSREERDRALGKEIAAKEAALKAKQAARDRQRQDAQRHSELLMELSQAIGDMEAEVTALEARVSEADRSFAEASAAAARAHDERKAAQREEDSGGAALKTKQAELRAAQQSYDKCMPPEVRRGLQGLDALRSRFGLDMPGVHGAVIEHIVTHDTFNVAIDTIAGNHLFDVLVESDDVAARLIEGLRRHGLGRVTFVPLNRAGNSPDLEPPKEFGTDVVPLLRKIQTDPALRPAMKDIFGQTLLCRDNNVATEVCRATDRFDCVTVEGDKVGRRGNMSGGFVAARRSRLAVYRALMAARKEVADVEARQAELAASVSRLREEEGAARAKADALDMERAKARKEWKQKKEDIRERRHEETGIRQETERADSILSHVENEITRIQSDLSALRKELKTDMVSKLSAAEQSEMNGLNMALPGDKERMRAAAAARDAAAAALSSAEANLGGNLRRQAEELEAGLAQDDVANDRAALSLKRSALASLSASLADTERAAGEARRRAEGLAKQAEELRAAGEEARDAAGQREAAAAEAGVQLEALSSRRAALTIRAADLERRVRDLGSLPQEAFERGYRDKSIKDLMKQLEQVNASLEKFAGVNRRALEQYVDFAAQREELQGRLRDSKDSEAKIRELIGALDMRKDEAIERTFKGVAKNFREVFADLVPGGTGELVMVRAAGRGAAAAEGEDEEGGGGGPGVAAAGSDKYSGVRVRVKFAGAGEAVSMRSLSGGQKTLVALALIFAIQRCDPAPFYLFDEIDAALDPQYRTTVASMLRRQASDRANPAQFIVTTFHPQIVSEADRLLGVAHKARVSRVYGISREDALTFLQAAEEHAGQAGASAADRAADRAAEGGATDGQGSARGRAGRAGGKEEAVAGGRSGGGVKARGGGKAAAAAAAGGRGRKRGVRADEEEEEEEEEQSEEVSEEDGDAMEEGDE